jgi:hypothetical protein
MKAVQLVETKGMAAQHPLSLISGSECYGGFAHS